MVEKVLRLLYRREKWLVVAAVRFLRTCLGLKDDFYNRYLVSSHAEPAAIGHFHAPLHAPCVDQSALVPLLQRLIAVVPVTISNVLHAIAGIWPLWHFSAHLQGAAAMKEGS